MAKSTTKPTTAATLTPTTSDNGRRLLIGHAEADIEAGSCLALVKEGDAYHLQQMTPDQMQAIEQMASFWEPSAVDHRERIEMADRIDPPQPAPRKRSKRSATKTTAKPANASASR